ncbi:MAG TPA: winged helix-turn-helix domain-containing protein [Acidimicrobiia bacterium]|nr:winged helix-turn-helix domain-containing protein [Acidimicrobiia bacterium]
MNIPGPADVFWLESEEHFDMLSDSTRLEMIELLMRPHSVGEVAEQMRVPRTRLYHHVNQLEQAGMIRVVDTRQAGAQTEKIYQATAYSYQPSDRYLEEAMPREKAQAVLTAIFGATEADFIRSVEEGAVTFDDRATRRRLHLRRGLLQLDDERLEEFIADLEAVYAKYDTDHLEAAPDDAQLVATVSLVYPSTRSIR